jgi:DNA-binding NarL/FixJ family response regulator
MSAIEEPTAIAGPPAGVLAVDDDRRFLALLRDVVGATAHLELVAEADCGERAVELARELAPDIVLMDVRMPGLGGIGAARLIKSVRPSTLVVLVSTTHPDELQREAAGPLADATIWKGELTPRVLDETWLRHRGQTSRAEV